MNVNPRDLARALVVACVIGIPVSLAALALLAGVGWLTDLLWTDLPKAAGFSGAAWWWVLLVPTVGAALVGLVVRKMPGEGGHEPIKGFSPSPVQPNAIAGVALAALGSLAFGAVLGPEAPLVALGSAMGLWFAHQFKLTGQLAPLAGAAGLFAAIGALFGDPLLAAFLILEVLGMASLGAPMAAVVVPGMLASALGYLVFVGVDNWTGISGDGFTTIPLPDYATVRPVDLIWAIVIGLLMAVIIAVIRTLATRSHALVLTRPALLAPAIGLAIGALAVAFAVVSDQPASLVLFSGEADTGTVVEQAAQWGLGTLLLLLVLKALAYALSLGSLLRGGPVFPSLFLGVVVGMLAAELVPGLETTPAVVAGMAASCAAMLRLPLSSVMLAVFLTGTAGLEATSIALFAAVAAFLGSVVIEKRAAGSDAAQPAGQSAPSAAHESQAPEQAG